ncbi:MAG: glycosyl hydrolase family 95 catalytic domain-containing protein [Faecousia sp.]
MKNHELPLAAIADSAQADIGLPTADCKLRHNYLKLWYHEPASDWQSQALPIGNGNIGGMIFGKTDTERVQVNEITLWAGGTAVQGYTGGNNANAWKNLAGIRQLLFAGKYSEAQSLVESLCGNGLGWKAYQNLGDLYLAFEGKANASNPEHYRRELDLNDGVARVSYENEGVSFRREYFASNPGNVMVIRLTASEKGTLSFKLTFLPDTSSDGYCNPSKTYTTTVKDHVIRCLGEVTSSKMKFAVQVKVVAPTAKLTDHANGTIAVENGEDVLIFMTAGTNYDISEADNIHEIGDFKTPDGDYLDNDDPDGKVAMEKAAKRIEEASAFSYEALLNRHMDDYRALFMRAALELGDEEYADIPTDELRERYVNGETNQYLETLLFQYGRYLLISSSRDAVLPANLQGLWNDSNTPSWSCDYHFDINLQMNYWPAFVTNLAQTAEPLVSLINSLRAPGNLTAREHFGVDKGWVVNAQINIFGLTGVGWKFFWGYAPGSGAWICNNLWDYYQFTQSREVLEKIYPILKGASEFWNAYLLWDDKAGEWISAPAGSPEHGSVGIGTTYDMSLSKMLMQDTIEAAKLLGKDTGEDAELVAALQEKVDNIKPFQIGDSGQLKEWREETTYSSKPGTEVEHRHMSHLLGLHPGSLITAETPELMKAAIRTLKLRGDGLGSWGAGGWSMAQKSNLWARTGDGDKALYYLHLLFQRGIFPNLFDHVTDNGMSEVFQIDGNLGATSAMAEMLIQSHAGYIQPLPALPTNWADGSYKGLRARGNFETDAIWSNCRLQEFVIRSGSGQTCTVRYPGIANAQVRQGGKAVEYIVHDANTIQFETTPGAEYVLTGFAV